MKCQRCKKKIGEKESRYGEKGKRKWKHWHHKCYHEKFAESVNGNSILQAKYNDIHGKSPEEVLGLN